MLAVELGPLCEEIAARYFARYPDDRDRYGSEVARAWEIHDTRHVLSWAIGDVEGRTDLNAQITWLASVLQARDFPLDSPWPPTSISQPSSPPSASTAALRSPGGCTQRPTSLGKPAPSSDSATKADVLDGVLSFRHMTQPAHISRPALPASSLRAAQSWWACR